MFENMLQASLKICECGRNNQQSYLSKLQVYFIFAYSVKFHYVKKTHNINSLLTLVKIVVASQHKDKETSLCQDLLTT